MIKMVAHPYLKGKGAITRVSTRDDHHAQLTSLKQSQLLATFCCIVKYLLTDHDIDDTAYHHRRQHNDRE